jgi:hypothetical protein
MQQQGWDLGWNQTGRTALILYSLGFIPALAALLTLIFAPGALTWPPRCLRTLGKPVYLLAAWTLLPFLGLLAAAISVLFHGAAWDLSLLSLHHDLALRWPDNAARLAMYPPPAWAVWLFSLVLSPIIFFVPAWVEEWGWRGFGFQWLRPRGFWFCALSLGGLSWLAKAPFIFYGYMYPWHPWLGLLVGLGFQLGISIVCTWLREASGGLWAPALARATLFGAAAIPLSFTADYDPLWTHLQGLAGVGLLALFALGLYGYSRYASSRIR